MALIAKLFQNKKYQCPSAASRIHKGDHNARFHQREFTKEQIQLVVFKDHDINGRQVIIDSRCVKKLTIDDSLCDKCLKLKHGCRRKYRMSSASCGSSGCPGLFSADPKYPKYKDICRGTNKNDAKLLGEMIFGTAPLASSGTSLKVHILRNPAQLLLSNVFAFRKNRESNTSHCWDFDQMSMDSLESSLYNSMHRSGSDRDLTGSVPVDMPSGSTLWSSDSSLNNSVTSSGSYSHTSPANSINSSSKVSMYRRLRHSCNKSLQYGLYPKFTKSHSDDTQSTASEPVVHRRVHVKIGMAVVFSLGQDEEKGDHFKEFFFSHGTLIEGQLDRLRQDVERSASQPSTQLVIEVIMEALERFQQNIYDLYTAPRVSNPVWLSMMASTSRRYAICDKFVKEFTLLLERYDTKSTEFFVSSLLTGVLMYHLAWVPTVTPSGAIHSAYADKHSAKWVDILAKSHPYNPLWAQLSDLYGAIGIPARQARTVVVGKRSDIVQRFLFMLSYFIRCSEIHESMDECYDDEFVNGELESAFGDICLTSMEEDASFIIVDVAESKTHDIDTESDSGLVSQYNSCGDERVTASRPSCILRDSESGFTEPYVPRNLPDSVPSSSPSDKVIEWINTSQHDNPVEKRDGDSTAEPTAHPLHKSVTDTTLVNESECGSPPAPTNTVIKCVELPISPQAEKIERIRAVGRQAAIDTEALPELSASDNTKTGSGESVKTLTSSSHLIKRLFAADIDPDEFNGYFRGNPPSLSRQSSSQSTSMFNEYYDNDEINLFDSCSQQIQHEAETQDQLGISNQRGVLFKVPKETGFHQNASHNQQKSDTENPQQLRSPTKGASNEEPFRSRILSISSRCSTPQTVKGASTPMGDARCRHMSSCPTIPSDTIHPFDNFVELAMPRSKDVHRLADTSVSTTSFGRQQLAGYSDHYLSDFVLHGTSDEHVISKVQPDLVSSVNHSVLEDPINEAVCVVADTDKWDVTVCSSMREQPKGMKASQLVINMLDTAKNLAKLRMSPEHILMHIEDRLQEMYFKSRMLAEYVNTRKKVDMDELNAMFGLDVSDIRFLLSVAGTHSTVNLQGIY